MTGTLHNLSDLDRVIHEPARLLLMALLSSVESCRLSLPSQGESVDQR